MVAASAGSVGTTEPLPTPRATLDSPWEWLAKGWQDYRRAPTVSVTYGAMYSVISVLLTVVLFRQGWGYLFLPLLAGFLLIGPFLAVGLYDVSRSLAQGEPVSLSLALFAWRRHGTQIGIVAMILMLFLLVWLRVGTLIFALMFGSLAISTDSFQLDTFWSFQTIALLVVGTAAGALFATIVFAVGAISLPLILDRGTPAFSAIANSVQTLRANVQPMVLWAGLIVVFTVVGLVTFFVGLIITLPLIGYATWHAYVDLSRERATL